MDPDESHDSVEHDDQASLSFDDALWAGRRAPEKPGDRMLSQEAVAWLDSLPQHVRPNDLAKRYPRICNRMVECWKYPSLMVPYFDDLLMDNRGGRQGFPMIIATEIASVKEHYLATLSATKANVWDRAITSPNS